MVLGRSSHDGLRGVAARLFDSALPAALKFTSVRAWAFTILAIEEYLQRFPGDRAARSILETLTQRLLDLYNVNASDEWPWLEPILSYDNARLPQALIVGGTALNRKDAVEGGLCSLRWLAGVVRSPGGHFVPIGSHGFYRKGGERPNFDQQPIEAQAMVSACLTALRCTGEQEWMVEAQRAFEWFLGRNDLRVSLYDPTTGACRDGLHPDRPNQNQGAESTLSFLLALLEMSLQRNVI